MKPFNLEEAIELHKPVVTRDGRTVILAGYNPRAIQGARIVGWLDDCVCFWWEDGKYASDRETSRDLFMQSAEAYVGFYTFNDDYGNVVSRTTENVFPTEQEAIDAVKEIVKTEFWNDIQNVKAIRIDI